MTAALALAELALLARLLLTGECLRRPAFTSLIVWSFASAVLYIPGFEHRDRYVILATISDVLKLAVVVEATIWLTQRPVLLQTLAYAILLGTILGDYALRIKNLHEHGTGLAYNTVALAFIAGMWIYAVGWTAGQEFMKKAGAKVTSFDLTLLVYLSVGAAGNLRFYFTERLLADGTVNPEWAAWEKASQLALILCMVLWALADRRPDYVYHEAIRDYREYKRGLRKKEAVLSRYAAQPR